MSETDRAAAAASEAIAKMLRLYGNTAPDIDDMGHEIARECESWSLWLTRQQDKGQDDGHRNESGHDWDALYRFCHEVRQREISYFHNCLQEYRDTVWQIISTISQSVSDESESDNTFSHSQLKSLKNAVSRGTDDEIIETALELSEAVNTAHRQHSARREYQFDSLGEHLRSLNSKLQQAHADMNVDVLTGVYNRAALEREMASLVKQAAVGGEPACLLMIDADHFKSINDTHGHAAGDEVLRRLAQCVRGNFSRKNDFVARYGGEEFIVILREADTAILKRLMERVLRAVRELEVDCGERTLRLTASMGVAVLRTGETAAAWFRRADDKLYAAKANGRDQYLLAD